jgi:RimJ/RimL family protein N-acetyltransferase
VQTITINEYCGDESIGCKVEGILRSNMPTADSDERRDSIILSILRSEWFDAVKKFEMRLY